MTVLGVESKSILKSNCVDCKQRKCVGYDYCSECNTNTDNVVSYFTLISVQSDRNIIKLIMFDDILKGILGIV